MFQLQWLKGIIYVESVNSSICNNGPEKNFSNTGLMSSSHTGNTVKISINFSCKNYIITHEKIPNLLPMCQKDIAVEVRLIYNYIII